MEEPTKTDADEASQKKSKMGPLLVLVVAGIGGYFVGTGFLAPRLLADTSAETDAAPTDEQEPDTGHGPPAADAGGEASSGHGAAPPPEGDSHFMVVGNLLVNPKGSRGLQFLMATVALEVEDADTRSILRQREAQVRDVVITVLERLTMEQLAAPGARDSIRVLINRVVADEFQLPFLNVFISQFVLN